MVTILVPDVPHVHRCTYTCINSGTQEAKGVGLSRLGVYKAKPIGQGLNEAISPDSPAVEQHERPPPAKAALLQK